MADARIFSLILVIIAVVGTAAAGCASEAYGKACASCSLDENGRIDESCQQGRRSSGTACVSY